MDMDALLFVCGFYVGRRYLSTFSRENGGKCMPIFIRQARLLWAKKLLSFPVRNLALPAATRYNKGCTRILLFCFYESTAQDLYEGELCGKNIRLFLLFFCQA